MQKKTNEKNMVEQENNERNHEIDDNLEIKEGNLDIFQKAKTYVYLKITINPAINPSIPKEGLPIPNEILKKEEKAYKQNTSDEICADFRKQLKIAIEAVAKVINNYKIILLYCF